jgi:hypothetical protein
MKLKLLSLKIVSSTGTTVPCWARDAAQHVPELRQLVDVEVADDAREGRHT